MKSTNKSAITINFESPENAEDFVDNIVLHITTNDDGKPIVSLGQLLNILIRCTAVLTLISCKKLEDVYHNASHFSSFIADAIQEALENKFQVNINIQDRTDVN